MTDTRRCGLCESLYHIEPNCPHGPPPPRYKVKYQLIGDNDVWGVIDKTTDRLVSGSLSYDEDAAHATCDRLNDQEPS